MELWTYFVIVAMVLIALLVIYYIVRKRKADQAQEQIKQQEDQKQQKQQDQSEHSTHFSQLTRDQALTPEDEEAIRILAEGISQHKTEFTGLYELMYQISLGNTGNASGTFGEWCLRVENFEEDSAFSEIFAKRFSEMESGGVEEQIRNAELIIQGIFASGIKRDEAQSLQAEKRTVFTYVTLDDTVITPGQSYEVYRPCWSIGALTLEKGILRSPELQETNEISEAGR
ncbi:hypothetical protein [Diplocloster modestus]|uniref:Tim44-like domain-containing protein n=1 Tax=Diplocloster modestus TaxID=2850322 RepID=A0ABS6KDM2_9FIRM|nr:hypothetical protein [Diplocloster modestus]MBU9728605.1 hypothetical protein [Diplocloster modestus]